MGGEEIGAHIAAKAGLELTIKLAILLPNSGTKGRNHQAQSIADIFVP